MKKRMAILAAILSCTLCFNVPVMAKDINDMTLEELKVAYLELQLEYEKLKNSVGEVEEADVATGDKQEETVLMDEEEFKKDIVDSFNGRNIVATQYTNAELETMTDGEIVEFNNEACESERELYEKYKNATFNDLNIQYLCQQYMLGLEKQYKAYEVWKATQNYDKSVEQFESGYFNRAYVIVELAEYYQLPFGDIESMKGNTAYMDSFNEAETRNAAVDHATVQKTQQLLNDIGFFCGTADGISGKRTVKSIKRFQEMYGYEPNDGMIDDELISQLETELSKKK